VLSPGNGPQKILKKVEIVYFYVQLVCLGLLAEICVRFEPQHRRRPYQVREVAISGTTTNHHADLLDKVT
jgi:hypothetical protein